jgi:hypothetical protein
MHNGVSIMGGRKLKFIAAMLAVLLTFEAVALPLAEAQQFENIWLQRRSALTPVSPAAAAPALARPQAPVFELASSALSVPSRFGRITQMWSPAVPTRHPMVVLIQDIHDDTDVQLNIADILDSLKNQGARLLVGIEGAWSALDFTPYDTTAYDEWREMTARAFLERGYISGAHYFALTHRPKDVRLVGVENKTPYLENLRARDRSKAERDQMAGALGFIEDRMDRIGRHLLPLPVQEFVKNKRHYEEGRLALSDYVHYLLSVSPQRPAAVVRYMELERTQEKLNPAELGQARETLLRKMAAGTTDDDAKNLLVSAKAYQEGRLSALGFHRALIRLAAQRGVAVPAILKTYQDYLEGEARFSADELLDSVAALEAAAKSKVCSTSSSIADVRRFLDLRSAIHEQKRLWTLELTPKTADEALRIGQSLKWAEAEAFLAALERSLGLKTAPTVIPPYYWQALQDVKTFYRLALSRNDYLVGNLMSAVKNDEPRMVVLMAGGFHTPGLTVLLKKNQFPYAVVQPSMDSNGRSENKVKVVGPLPDPWTKISDAPRLLLDLKMMSTGVVDPLIQSGLKQTVGGEHPEIRTDAAAAQPESKRAPPQKKNEFRNRFLIWVLLALNFVSSISPAWAQPAPARAAQAAPAAATVESPAIPDITPNQRLEKAKKDAATATEMMIVRAMQTNNQEGAFKDMREDRGFLAIGDHGTSQVFKNKAEVFNYFHRQLGNYWAAMNMTNYLSRTMMSITTETARCRDHFRRERRHQRRTATTRNKATRNLHCIRRIQQQQFHYLLHLDHRRQRR